MVSAASRMGGFKSAPQKPSGDMAPKARGEVKNQGTPAGDFGEFLRKRVPKQFKRSADTNADEARERFIAAMKQAGAGDVGVQAVRKWEQGASSPPLKDLGAVAKALGYRDWFAMVADIGKRGR